MFKIQACEQHRGGGLHPQWVFEKDCTSTEGLTKKDVYVLSEFEGAVFEHLKSTKCLWVFSNKLYLGDFIY